MREDHERESSGLSTSSRNKKRPYLASLCDHLHDAEKYRSQIIHEISNGVRDIQNPGLGEHAIRDLNDKLNKLMREKHHWNKRILELSDGKIDYNRKERKEQLMEEGGDMYSLRLGSGPVYRYFGEARNLPGVQELFRKQEAKSQKRKRGDMMKHITPDYFGFRDEEDGVLLELEEEYSKVCRSEMQKDGTKPSDTNSSINTEDEEFFLNYFEEEGGGIMAAGDAFQAHVSVPTQDIVAEVILERKKRELLDRLVV